MKDIIKLLQDDREYYDGVGKNYLSNSNIGDLLKNPKNFNKKQLYALSFYVVCVCGVWYSNIPYK